VTPFAAAPQTREDVGDQSESGDSAEAPSRPLESGSEAPQPIDAARSDAEAASAEALEPASVEADTDADRLPAAALQSEPAPVDAEPDATSTQTEATATVEWRAPSVQPPAVATSSPSDDRNGIPPAPSDEARYDDIWTAAFAPPEQATSPVNGGPHIEAVDAAISDPEPSETIDDMAAVTAEAPPDTSPDDLPSPPEDEISAEDDMWSLRARLAEAAARKQPPHEID
jgi:hypothetical protein